MNRTIFRPIIQWFRSCEEFFRLILELTSPINVLINASKVLKNQDKKKEVENDLLSCLALQVGLEPTTYGLTVRRSNQLSY